MENNLQGHGLILPTITPDNYVLGGVGDVPKIVLQKDGQWLDFLPDGEWQARKNFDTFGCTVYNTIHAEEILEKRLFEDQVNYAERPVYISMGITPPGSNPHLVSEYIRNNGLTREESLPFDDSITSLELYNQPNPLPYEILYEIKQWYEKYDYKHEWVMLPSHDLKEKQERLMEALTYSPIGFAVQAWQERNGLYFQDGEPNHWTVIIGYKKGEYWIVFDSYEPYIKKLEWDTDISFAKRYFIQKKVATQPTKPLTPWQTIQAKLSVLLSSCSHSHYF